MLAHAALLIATFVLLAACKSHDAGNGASGAELSIALDDAVVALAAGDIADCRRVSATSGGAMRTTLLVESELRAAPGAVVLSLGDHTYPLGTPDEFRDCYAPSWGRFLARTYPVPGNHEYYSPHAGGYYAYFGSRAGAEWRGYYSLRHGSWKLIALNSVLQGDAGHEQLAWLRAELAADPAACILAYWHHPRYSSGGHGSDRRMQAAWVLLLNAGADLVLSAHDHGYERFARQDAEGRHYKNGIRQFVVGTGGAELTLFRRTQPHSEMRQNESFGVLKLKLGNGAYGWEFLAVDGSIGDRGRAHCNPKRNPG